VRKFEGTNQPHQIRACITSYNVTYIHNNIHNVTYMTLQAVNLRVPSAHLVVRDVEVCDGHILYKPGSQHPHLQGRAAVLE